MQGEHKYEISEADLVRLERTFTYHPPKADQPARYIALRAMAKAFAMAVLQNCPSSRERSLALTHIEEAIMQANASIARYE